MHAHQGPLITPEKLHKAINANVKGFLRLADFVNAPSDSVMDVFRACEVQRREGILDRRKYYSGV